MGLHKSTECPRLQGARPDGAPFMLAQKQLLTGASALGAEVCPGHGPVHVPHGPGARLKPLLAVPAMPTLPTAAAPCICRCKPDAKR